MAYKEFSRHCFPNIELQLMLLCCHGGYVIAHFNGHLQQCRSPILTSQMLLDTFPVQFATGMKIMVYQLSKLIEWLDS